MIDRIAEDYEYSKFLLSIVTFKQRAVTCLCVLLRLKAGPDQLKLAHIW